MCNPLVFCNQMASESGALLQYIKHSPKQTHRNMQQPECVCFLMQMHTHLVDSCQDALGGGCADLDGVGAIGQDFRLHDGHQAILLADARVARQPICILMDGLRSANGLSQTL